MINKKKYRSNWSCGSRRTLACKTTTCPTRLSRMIILLTFFTQEGIIPSSVLILGVRHCKWKAHGHPWHMTMGWPLLSGSPAPHTQHTRIYLNSWIIFVLSTPSCTMGRLRWLRPSPSYDPRSSRWRLIELPYPR